MSDTPITDWLFSQPVTPKQKALNELDELESMMLDSANMLRLIKSDSHIKTLCNECLEDIALAKHLLNNWDSLEGANDLIGKIKFKRGLIWQGYAELSIKKTSSGKGGENKKGYQSPIKQFIRKICESEKLYSLDASMAARKIATLLKDGNEMEVYKYGEICPIDIIEYDAKNELLHYSNKGKPDENKRASLGRIQKIIIELKNIL